MGATWLDVETSNPEFAAKAQAFFDAHRHKFLGTIRKDGSPRISGTETVFLNGNIYLGMMVGSRKAMDLRRDPRLTVHSGSNEPETWSGDVKLSGTGIEVTDEDELEAFRRAGEATRASSLEDEKTAPEAQESPEPFHLFKISIDEVAMVTLSEAKDHLVIERWHPGQPIRRVERR